MNTLPPISDVRKPVPSPMAPSSTITRNSGTDSPKSPIFEQQQHSGEVSDGASSNGPGQHEVHSPQSSLKWSFNNLLNLPQQHRLHNDAKSGTHSEGLSDVPVDTLSHCLRPVLEGLRHLDAEALLELHRVSTTGHTTPTAGVSAARIREGYVLPCTVRIGVSHIQLLPTRKAEFRESLSNSVWMRVFWMCPTLLTHGLTLCFLFVLTVFL